MESDGAVISRPGQENTQGHQEARGSMRMMTLGLKISCLVDNERRVRFSAYQEGKSSDLAPGGLFVLRLGTRRGRGEHEKDLRRERAHHRGIYMANRPAATTPGDKIASVTILLSISVV